MAQTTQIAVLGAGPGGYAAAFYAADLGMQVTLIDVEKNPGGVCLYRGCIPSKALLHVAKVVDEATHASKWGVTYGAPSIDVDKLRAYKQGVVDKLTAGVGSVAKLRKVNFVQGRATLTGPKSLTVKTAAGNEVELVDGGYCANNPTLYAIADATGSLHKPVEDLRVVSIGVGTYPEPKPGLMMLFAKKYLLSVQLLQKTLEINTQSMDQLRTILFGHVATIRISDTFEKPEMATDLMEHDLKKLNLLHQRGGDSFAGREADLAAFLR